jgi:hypothetical protein
MYNIINIPIINSTFETNKQTNTMAVSTVSTVNMYLLSENSAPVVYVPGVVQTDMQFPDSFTGMTTYMNNLNTNDARIVFSSGMSGVPWRDVANGYEVECSSYTTWSGLQLAGQDMYNGLQSTFWSPSLNDAAAAVYYRNGVNQGKFTQKSYSTAGAYIGGGSGKFFTTTYNGASVNGEWFQIKFPFKSVLKTLEIMASSNPVDRAPATVTVLGSDNGSTWLLIGNLTYSGYAVGVYNSRSVSTSDQYYYYRVVIKTLNGTTSQILNVGAVRYTYDAWMV